MQAKIEKIPFTEGRSPDMLNKKMVWYDYADFRLFGAAISDAVKEVEGPKSIFF